MWWDDIRCLDAEIAQLLAGRQTEIDASAIVECGATIDDRAGAVRIGAGTRICAGAILRGPLIIGANAMIGNQVMLRGPSIVGDNVRIGYATEIKQSLIGGGTSIGPMCFIGDSRIDEAAYLGAQVRTSNHRLDGQPVSVRQDGVDIDTGMDKLGCWIGARASLGIQVIILPGRVIAEGSMFEPRVTISNNLPAGRYRIKQIIERVESKETPS